MLGLLLPTLITTARHDHSGRQQHQNTGIPYSRRPYNLVLFEQWIGVVRYRGAHLPFVLTSIARGGRARIAWRLARTPTPRGTPQETWHSSLIS